MAWLYEIERQIAELNELAVDPETGEINEEVIAELAALCEQSEHLQENLGLLYKRMSAEVAAYKTEKQRIDEEIRSRAKRMERIKGILTDTRCGTNLVTPQLSLKFSRTRASLQLDKEDEESVLLYCIDHNMDDCYKTVQTISRAEIGKRVKTGEEIPKCAWKPSTEWTLSIK